MIGLLALLLSWSPVAVDCAGQPEAFVRYELTFVAWACRDLETEFPACGRFIAESRLTDTEWRTSIGKPDPDPGSGYWFEVIAIDGGGNVQCAE